MIDKISQAEGIAMNTIQSKALIGIGATSAAYLLWSFLFSTHVSIFHCGCDVYSDFFA